MKTNKTIDYLFFLIKAKKIIKAHRGEYKIPFPEIWIENIPLHFSVTQSEVIKIMIITGDMVRNKGCFYLFRMYLNINLPSATVMEGWWEENVS